MPANFSISSISKRTSQYRAQWKAGGRPGEERIAKKLPKKKQSRPKPGLSTQQCYRWEWLQLTPIPELFSQVPTKSLNLAVRRNQDRFPEDFMFQLTKEEAQALRFQFETSKTSKGGRRYAPYAFTEHG